jgi:hypothetical protein
MATLNTKIIRTRRDRHIFNVVAAFVTGLFFGDTDRSGHLWYLVGSRHSAVSLVASWQTVTTFGIWWAMSEIRDTLRKRRR